MKHLRSILTSPGMSLFSAQATDVAGGEHSILRVAIMGGEPVWYQEYPMSRDLEGQFRGMRGDGVEASNGTSAQGGVQQAQQSAVCGVKTPEAQPPPTVEQQIGALTERVEALNTAINMMAAQPKTEAMAAGKAMAPFGLRPGMFTVAGGGEAGAGLGAAVGGIGSTLEELLASGRGVLIRIPKPESAPAGGEPAAAEGAGAKASESAAEEGTCGCPNCRLNRMEEGLAILTDLTKNLVDRLPPVKSKAAKPRKAKK